MLQSGKSGTMFFSTAYSSAGQLRNDGSTTFTRASARRPLREDPVPDRAAPGLHESDAWPPAGSGGSEARVRGPSGSPLGRRARSAAPTRAPRRGAASCAPTRRPSRSPATRTSSSPYGGEGRVAPGVGVDPAGAGHQSHHLHLARGRRGQSPGALQPLEHHRVVERQARDLLEVVHEPLDDRRSSPRSALGDRTGDAARDDRAAEEPVAGQRARSAAAAPRGAGSSARGRRRSPCR